MDASTFRSTIITEFELQNLSPDEQSDYVNQIGELVLQGVIIKSLSAMDTNHTAELDHIIDQGKEAHEIMHYLESTIPGFADLVRDEIQAIKLDLKTGMGQV